MKPLHKLSIVGTLTLLGGLAIPTAATAQNTMCSRGTWQKINQTYDVVAADSDAFKTMTVETLTTMEKAVNTCYHKLQATNKNRYLYQIPHSDLEDMYKLAYMEWTIGAEVLERLINQLPSNTSSDPKIWN